ncbi:UDP-N-acetylmuramoyl-L-alanyl-D-glutamate--2,6-diaminopimelate ligase [Candidatus Omnitrophota bacterium]
MRLNELFKSVAFSLSQQITDFQVKGITSDSRKVSDGFIFVAVKGANFDGHDFIKQAISGGAKLIIAEKQITDPSIKGKCYRVEDTRKALTNLVSVFSGNPSRLMKVVGITGTNGKTTVSYLIEAILKYTRSSPAVIGTINYRFKNQVFNAVNTTPGCEQIQELLSRMQKAGEDYVVMEVSSHALDQERVGMVRFNMGIFTNLAVDHLDYHRDVDSYFAAKSKLFRQLSPDGFAILNIDDARALKLKQLTKARVITYGLVNQADVKAEELCSSLEGTELVLSFSPQASKDYCGGINRLMLRTSLIGRHNVYNILAAVAFAITQGIDAEIIKVSMENFKGVPGRLEKVATGSNFMVLVDYAHTQDALRNVISSLRPLCKGRLTIVFGCGGERDKGKRPEMGKVATELADYAVITTDNPRGEDPVKIIEDIISGISKKNFEVVADRREAIKQALCLAKKDDIILLAGKGHENYQIFKDKTIHFDDREVAREFLPSQ